MGRDHLMIFYATVKINFNFTILYRSTFSEDARYYEWSRTEVSESVGYKKPINVIMIPFASCLSFFWGIRYTFIFFLRKLTRNIAKRANWTKSRIRIVSFQAGGIVRRTSIISSKLVEIWFSILVCAMKGIYWIKSSSIKRKLWL